MIIQVKVRPGARRSELRQGDDGQWVALLKSPPVDGKANAELIALVAAAFGRPKSAVAIRRGGASRTKWVEIDGGRP